MTDQQTVIALRTEAERLGLIAIEAQHAAALKEREYRIALGEVLDKLIMQYSDLAEKERDDTTHNANLRG